MTVLNFRETFLKRKKSESLEEAPKILSFFESLVQSEIKNAQRPDFEPELAGSQHSGRICLKLNKNCDFVFLYSPGLKRNLIEHLKNDLVT